MKTPDKPTMKRAILARCHNCSHFYLDGKEDCENTRCELYTWMPYRKKNPDLAWLDINPAKKGLVKWEDCKERVMSPEHLEALKKGREEAREKKGE